MSDPLFQLPNPFVPNPNFNTPEDNFIERGISNGIERGIGKVGDNIMNRGQVKLDSFAHNIPEIATLAMICYLIYLGYKSFIINGRGKNYEFDFSQLYTIFMIYIIFKLFWKVVLHI